MAFTSAPSMPRDTQLCSWATVGDGGGCECAGRSPEGTVAGEAAMSSRSSASRCKASTVTENNRCVSAACGQLLGVAASTLAGALFIETVLLLQLLRLVPDCVVSDLAIRPVGCWEHMPFSVCARERRSTVVGSSMTVHSRSVGSCMEGSAMSWQHLLLRSVSEALAPASMSAIAMLSRPRRAAKCSGVKSARMSKIARVSGEALCSNNILTTSRASRSTATWIGETAVRSRRLGQSASKASVS
mmetsp:Transcript_118080/g.341387  ORF Transcript_118080/g.341387 Transcript_118080/m.341387 type:complete len:244 (+) Transcript_118080:2894-3625(+)